MTTRTTNYYWIAVNGNSVALCRTPMPVGCTAVPTPERLFGFPTMEEAVAAQHMMLTAPMPEARRQMGLWVQRPDVAYVVPKDPEPPTRGPTAWVSGPDSEGEEAVRAAMAKAARYADE